MHRPSSTAAIAGHHDVVIDLHFDPVTEQTPAPPWLSSPPNPPAFLPNIDAFERLLQHERKAKIVWALRHPRALTVALSRRLLEKHPNLYMSLRVRIAHENARRIYRMA